MKDMLKITLSLVAIFVVAGLIMGVTYKYTSPVRFQAEKKEKEEALKEMAPDATDPIKAGGELVRRTTSPMNISRQPPAGSRWRISRAPRARDIQVIITDARVSRSGSEDQGRQDPRP